MADAFVLVYPTFSFVTKGGIGFSGQPRAVVMGASVRIPRGGGSGSVAASTQDSWLGTLLIILAAFVATVVWPLWSSVPWVIISPFRVAIQGGLMPFVDGERKVAWKRGQRRRTAVPGLGCWCIIPFSFLFCLIFSRRGRAMAGLMSTC